MGMLNGSDCPPTKTLEIKDSDKKKVIIENCALVAWMARN
jgi:hypothetical protein